MMMTMMMTAMMMTIMVMMTMINWFKIRHRSILLPNKPCLAGLFAPAMQATPKRSTRPLLETPQRHSHAGQTVKYGIKR